MAKCTKCQSLMERSVKAEHTEDLGGIVVNLVNAVVVRHCGSCSAEETAIPDMQGLVHTVALVRALDPIRLAGKEVRFMRRALDMTQKKFAEVMELTAETVSRWENGINGHGTASEKLLRHNVCALLHKRVVARAYDPALITNMKFEGGSIEYITMERVRVVHESDHENAWDRRAVA